MSNRDITSTDWHLEGVSVEMRRGTAAYAKYLDVKQGVVVDQALREYLADKFPQPLAAPQETIQSPKNRA